jgi:hypothetical protein
MILSGLNVFFEDIVILCRYGKYIFQSVVDFFIMSYKGTITGMPEQKRLQTMSQSVKGTLSRDFRCPYNSPPFN